MRIVDLGCVNIRMLTVVVSGLNFARSPLFNAEEIVVDNAVYRLSISESIPEIFTVKL